MLDPEQKHREKVRSSRDVVHQKNAESVLDRKKSNTEVMEEAGYQRSLIKTIRKRQMKFLGDIFRKDGIEKQVLCGKIVGRRGKGCRETPSSTASTTMQQMGQLAIQS